MEFFQFRRGHVPFPSSSPGEFFFLSSAISFLLFLASFCSFLRATTIPAELTSFFLSPSRSGRSSSSSRSSCKDRPIRSKAETDEGSSLVTVFRRLSGHFRRPLLKLEACLTPILSNSSQTSSIST